jgi:hypothetical protein
MPLLFIEEITNLFFRKLLDKVGILFLNVSLFSLKPYIGEINKKRFQKKNCPLLSKNFKRKTAP